MITKWTSIKSVLFDLVDFIPKEFYNEGKLTEDCMTAVGKIGAVVTFQERVAFLKVENHKACVPIDCLQIIQIAHKNNFCLSHEDIVELSHIQTECEPCYNPPVHRPAQTVVYGDRFYRSWTPLKLSTSSFALAVHCDNSINLTSTCNQEYSVSPDGTMTFSFEKGYICIAYYCYPMDCDGVPLIPDDEDYKEALKDFCLMKSWELRWNMKEDGADTRYMKYQQLWGLMKAKATASIRMPDVAKANNMMNISLQLIPNTRRFDNFFQNLAEHENLQMNGRKYWYR